VGALARALGCRGAPNVACRHQAPVTPPPGARHGVQAWGQAGWCGWWVHWGWGPTGRGGHRAGVAGWYRGDGGAHLGRYGPQRLPVLHRVKLAHLHSHHTRRGCTGEIIDSRRADRAEGPRGAYRRWAAQGGLGQGMARRLARGPLGPRNGAPSGVEEHRGRPGGAPLEEEEAACRLVQHAACSMQRSRQQAACSIQGTVQGAGPGARARDGHVQGMCARARDERARKGWAPLRGAQEIGEGDSDRGGVVPRCRRRG
jgi:hypothetical protein